jgi:hypothetical protein
MAPKPKKLRRKTKNSKLDIWDEPDSLLGDTKSPLYKDETDIAVRMLLGIMRMLLIRILGYIEKPSRSSSVRFNIGGQEIIYFP